MKQSVDYVWKHLKLLNAKISVDQSAMCVSMSAELTKMPPGEIYKKLDCHKLH